MHPERRFNVWLGIGSLALSAATTVAFIPGFRWLAIPCAFLGVAFVVLALRTEAAPPPEVQVLPPPPELVAVLTEQRVDDWALNVAPVAIRNIGGTAARNVTARSLRLHGYTFQFDPIRVLDPDGSGVPLRYKTTDVGLPSWKGVSMDALFDVNWFAAALRGVVKEQGKEIKFRLIVDGDGPDGTTVTEEVVIACDEEMRLRIVS